MIGGHAVSLADREGAGNVGCSVLGLVGGGDGFVLLKSIIRSVRKETVRNVMGVGLWKDHLRGRVQQRDVAVVVVVVV